MLVALVYAIGPISGCHVNPAVTLGFIASGRMKLDEGVAYLVAQFAGGIVGAYLLYWMFTTSPLYHKAIQGLGTDGYGKQSHLFVSQGGAFLIEVVLTAIFVTVVLFATHKAAIQGAAGVAIGFGLVIVHLIGIPLTGTSVNPARSLGPALVVGGTALSQVWVFIVAPLVGAARRRDHPFRAGRPVQGRDRGLNPAHSEARPKLEAFTARLPQGIGTRLSRSATSERELMTAARRRGLVQTTAR